MPIKLIIAADHRGFKLKQALTRKSRFGEHKVVWIDVGAANDERSDYPLFAKKAMHEMEKTNATGAVLLCGSGVGMAITANRQPGVYAAVVWNTEIARVSKEDDNSNVIALPADYLSLDEAVNIITAWLASMFKGGRYAERLALIDQS
jgi:ribose 5-phosphate isomerase B